MRKKTATSESSCDRNDFKEVKSIIPYKYIPKVPKYRLPSPISSPCGGGGSNRAGQSFTLT